MITPDYLDDVALATERAVSKLNEELVKKITKRILAGYKFYGEVTFIPATIHDLQKMVYDGAVMEDIEDAITKALPGLEAEVAKAFKTSAKDISDTMQAMTSSVIEVIDQNGNIVPPPPKDQVLGIPTNAKDLNLTAPEVRNLESAYRRTQGTVRNLCKTTAGSANQAFIDACDSAFMKIQSGMSPNEAIIDAITDMAKRGVTTITYPTGKTDRVEVAIARAVRTGVSQANADIILTRCAEMGIQYVRVSEHLGARVTKNLDYTNHAWWQGQVYKLDYTRPALAKYEAQASEGQQEYPYLAQLKKALAERGGEDYPDFVKTCGYGNMLGICGINCRHTFNMFIPGLNREGKRNYTYDENAERYKQTQKMRAMERKMRELKRQLVALKEMRDNEDANRAYGMLKRRYEVLDLEYRTYARSHNLGMENYRREVPGIYHKVPSRISGEYTDDDTRISTIPIDLIRAKQHKKDIEELHEKIKDMFPCKSEWSGETFIDRLTKRNGYVAERKTADGTYKYDIVLKYKTSMETKLHELIHTFSISRYGNNVYQSFRGIEEACTETLTEIIGKEINIPISPMRSYPYMVDRLNKILDMAEVKDRKRFLIYLTGIEPIERFKELQKLTESIRIKKGIEAYKKAEHYLDEILEERI